MIFFLKKSSIFVRYDGDMGGRVRASIQMQRFPSLYGFQMWHGSSGSRVPPAPRKSRTPRCFSLLSNANSRIDNICLQQTNLVCNFGRQGFSTIRSSYRAGLYPLLHAHRRLNLRLVSLIRRKKEQFGSPSGTCTRGHF